MGKKGEQKNITWIGRGGKGRGLSKEGGEKGEEEKGGLGEGEKR